MKILQKLLIILVISVFTIGIVPQVQVQASVKDYLNNIQGTDVTDTKGVSTFVAVMQKVLGILQLLSGIMAVIVVAWTGFKMIIESADGKAQLKEKMLPIIIGAILVFAATSIANFIIGVTMKARSS